MDKLLEIKARFDQQGVCITGGDYHIDVKFLLAVLQEMDQDAVAAAVAKASPVEQ